MILFLLFICLSSALGQLILGPCPYPPKYVKNLDLNKYSGTWYVVAQSRQHPLNAVNCQRVTYYPSNRGLNAYFNASKNDSALKHRNGTLTKQNMAKSSGDLQLSLDNFPRHYQYRVLHVDYPNVAVEYICLYGVLNYTASVTVLHRKQPGPLMDLNSALYRLNLTTIVPSEFKSSMRLVNHTNCSD